MSFLPRFIRRTVALVMTSGMEPPARPGESQSRDSAVRQVEPTVRIAGRLALGLALEERTDDIVRWCQLEFVKYSGATFEEVAAPRSAWGTISLAVHSIANWLKSGVSADLHDREQIASLVLRDSNAWSIRTRARPVQDETL